MLYISDNPGDLMLSSEKIILSFVESKISFLDEIYKA
jgi:hypothetical protein